MLTKFIIVLSHKGTNFKIKNPKVHLFCEIWRKQNLNEHISE